VPDQLRLECRLEELDRASEWLGARLGLLAVPDDTAFAVRLCVEEALANVVTHGFEEEDDGAPILLGFEAHPGELKVVVEDQGMAFDPLQAPAPALPTSLEDAAIGGRGISLIKSYASRLAYERRDNANVLSMGFVLP